MRLALIAGLANRRMNVPVGTIVVDSTAASSARRAHNRRQIDMDPTGHAEIVALRQAAVRVGTWRLHGAALFATLEPCPMCAGALVNARIARVVYGCDDPKAGALRSLYALGADVRLNHRFDVVPGVLATECARLLSDFCGITQWP
jgi:tRNA(adenine34) deaminase